jgi:hypothetical protein
VILSWSAALLTASYAGMFAKMDPTFIATVFTASAATFGINTMKKGGDEEDEKNEDFADINKDIGDLKDKFQKMLIQKGEFLSSYYILLNK